MSDAAPTKIIIRKVRKKAHGGHHGGSWKVAYADFVTAMMAFFMVMWILGMDENVRKAVEGYFANPVGYKNGGTSGSSPIGAGANPAGIRAEPVRLLIRTSQAERFVAAGQRMEERLHQDGRLERLGVRVEIVVNERGMRIALMEGAGGEGFFPVGSAVLRTGAGEVLHIVAEELRGMQNPVVIEGHTDAAPFGRAGGYGNWELSAERANAARREMERAGLHPGRVVAVRGLADRELRVPERPRDPANRRISVFLPFQNPPAPPADGTSPEGTSPEGTSPEGSLSPGGAPAGQPPVTAAPASS